VFWNRRACFLSARENDFLLAAELLFRFSFSFVKKYLTFTHFFVVNDKQAWFFAGMCGVPALIRVVFCL
jgi:hypothetical protein